MINLLHAADLHLDTPFSNLPPEQAAQARQQQRQLLTQLPRLCRTYQCQLILLAGDLFDSPQIFRNTTDVLRQVLAECPAEVFIAPGNHDPITPDSPYLRLSWPKQVHIFKTPDIETIDCGAYTVSGAAFTPSRCPSLAGFHAPADPRPHFMVLHGDPFRPDSVHAPILPEEIAASGLTYLALGHIHRRGDLQQQGRTYYAWPGCLMGRGFDETGQKGLYLVQTEPMRLRFLPTNAPRYEILELPAGNHPLQAIQAALPQRDTSRDHYRIRLTGSGPKPDLAALQTALAAGFASLTLEDATTRPSPLPEAGDDTLQGLFVKNIQTQLAQTQDLELRQTLELALQLGLDILAGREVQLP